MHKLKKKKIKCVSLCHTKQVSSVLSLNRWYFEVAKRYLNANRGLLIIFERGLTAVTGFKRLQSKQKQMVGKFSTSNHSFQLQGMLRETSLKEPCFRLMKYHFFTKVHLKLKDV